MLHILLFEKWRNKKNPSILFLHGLDGKQDENQLEILKDLGINTVSLSIDYRKEDAWEVVKDLKVDGVIGHSLGGYLAYYFSNFRKIPCLMFMPDFGKEMYDIQSLPKKILELSVYKDKMVVTGSNDDDVDLEKNKQILKGIDLYEVNSDHMPSIKVFKKYCKLFKNRSF